MPDEKRIKDFEPATELLIDDWFAVDSPSQGTRKMQASMFQEGLQTQITTNTENIALHSGQISVLQQGVGNIGDKVDVLDAAITVEAYSASKLYAVGEDCVYEGVRYKCITAIETPEAFDPNKWQAISIEGELNELNSSLTYTPWTPLGNRNGVYFEYRYNKTTMSIRYKGDLTQTWINANSGIQMANIPANLRPSWNVAIPIIYLADNGSIYFSITPLGAYTGISLCSLKGQNVAGYLCGEFQYSI